LRGQEPFWDNKDMVVQRLARRIPLTQGKFAWVDAADYAAVVAAGPWHAVRSHEGIWYAARNIRIGGRSRTGQWSRRVQALHTFLTGWPLVDHEDGDGLNNRRNNLRKATDAQNSWNRGLSSRNTSGYKAVYQVARNRWRAQIVISGKQKRLGYFGDPRAAGREYDKAAIHYFGEFAVTNVMLGLLPPLRKFKLAGHPVGR
jgi:hypothetical protein